MSYKTVIYYLKQMDLHRKVTREMKELIKRLYEEGYSIEYISKVVGISRSKVFYHLKNMNIERRHDMKGKFKLTIKVPKEEWKLGYIAGIIDGEGTISFSKSRLGRFRKQPFIPVKTCQRS